MNMFSTVMIVDDNEFGRDVLEGILSQEGYKLLFADSGKSALEQMVTSPPDVVLLDVMMPGMDGFEVCQRVRKDPLLAEIPVIMVTSLDDQSSRMRGLEAGADDFISKPFNRAELCARIRTITRLNRYRRLLQMEEKIRKQAALLDVAHDAIIVCQLDGMITFWNKSAERIYHWSPEKAVTANITTLLFKGETSKYQDFYNRLLKNGSLIEDITLYKETNRIIVNTCWTLVKSDTLEPELIFITSTDITEKKVLEEKFLRAQRLENIGALASGVAHDLNNILSPILMGLQILRKKVTDQRGQVLLDTLEVSAQRGADLVKQVLYFGRGLEANRSIVQIKHLVSELEKIVQETFPKTVSFYSNIPSSLWTVSADPTQIYQILMNLLVNARDAMPQGGAIKITGENLTIDQNYVLMNPEAKIGLYTLITVSDNGSGIPQEIISKIFEPFFTTKEVGKGTGLGLATVKDIITGHGGFLELESKIGHGTKIKLFFPAIESEKIKVEAQSSQNFTGTGKTILVVEDEAAIREITKASLESFDYKVLTASDGLEALMVYSQNSNNIYAVIIDLMMPNMDGATTIRILQKMNPDLKVIVVTGLSVKKDTLSLSDLSIQATLNKPYTAEKLLNCLIF